MLGPDQNGNSESNTNIDNLVGNKQALYINITGLWSLAKEPRQSVLNLLEKDQGRSKPVIFPP